MRRVTSVRAAAIGSLIGGTLLLVLGSVAQATEITPDFTNVPTGWSVDRYSPDGFANIGTFQGKNNVLGITIGPNGDSSNRSCCAATFYNTQGEGHAISGGAGSSISAYLYVPGSWANPANGSRRTDMWGFVTIPGPNPDFAIIGFSNNNTSNNNNTVPSFVGFRAWDDSSGTWIDLTSATVDYDNWNLLSIEFTGTDYDYFVNGLLVDTIAASPGATGFEEIAMQAYNFNDPTLHTDSPVVPGPNSYYEADWANIPEPASMALLGTALLGFGGIGWRRRRKG